MHALSGITFLICLLGGVLHVKQLLKVVSKNTTVIVAEDAENKEDKDDP